jgi:transcriptional regulator with XRE-family HTH domain
MGHDRLRRARERAGLTQAGLASRAEVSRQLVGAVEAGRNVPAVDAALRIAAALGVGVEELFGPPPEATAVTPVLGVPLSEGEPVRLARVGDLLCAASAGDLVAGDGAWSRADGVAERAGVRRLPGWRDDGFLVVGCDPLLGLCESLLADAGPARTVAVGGTSGQALAALEAGRAHAAVVHGPEGALPPAAPGVLRLQLARWRVGVAGPRAGALGDLVAGRVPLIQREPSAASQQALARAAAGAALPAPAAVATGHIDAARRAALTGVAALTFEPAAHRHGLRFLPLETHSVELRIAARWTGHPGAEALGDLLASAALRERLALVGGYDLAGCGSAVAAA